MRWTAVVLPISLALLVANARDGEKCYGDLGCLELDEPFHDPVHRPVVYTPADRNEMATRFLLYTWCSDPRKYTELRWDSDLDEIRAAPYNASRETKFLVHGYIDRTSFGPWMNDMKNAYLKHADVNVVVVDWSDANLGMYEGAVTNARIVGAEIALFVRKLQETFGGDPKSMHIIGHSLGAHVAGYAGANITSLGRTTALDPAEPYFEKTPPVVRLDQTDAEFVDLIHTDSHPFLAKLWDLNRHLRSIHLQVKPLMSGHCHKKFAKEASLIRHMRTLHREMLLQSVLKA